MVEVKRFELWTFRTSSERSNQLSYTSVPRDEPQPTALTMVIVSCFFSKSNTFFQKRRSISARFAKSEQSITNNRKILAVIVQKKERLSSFPFPRVCFATLVLLMNNHSNGSRDNHLHCAVQKTPFRLHPGFARKHSRRILRHSQRIHNYRTM